MPYGVSKCVDWSLAVCLAPNTQLWVKWVLPGRHECVSESYCRHHENWEHQMQDSHSWSRSETEREPDRKWSELTYKVILLWKCIKSVRSSLLAFLNRLLAWFFKPGLSVPFQTEADFPRLTCVIVNFSGTEVIWRRVSPPSGAVQMRC